MRPLASATHEYRVLGLAEVAVAVFFAIVAAILNPVEAVVGVSLGSVLTAGAVYLALLRPNARRAIAEARPAPPVEREEPGAAVRRVAWPVAGQLAVSLILAGIARGPGLFGGIALGIGVAALLTERQIAYWETAHGAAVLRDRSPRAQARASARVRRARPWYVERPE
jgi:hypothetical protein